MRWRLAIFGGAGVLATLLAAMLVYTPDLLRGLGPVGAAARALSAADPALVMVLATALLGLYAAVAARSGGERGQAPGSTADRRYEAAASAPPESVTADRRVLAAAHLDADIQTAIEDGDGLGAVRDVLATTAASAYAERENCGRERARDAVERGVWTDDRLAAAVLAGPAGPGPSLLSRLRLWLAPDSERERRVRRTVEAIRDLEDEQ